MRPTHSLIIAVIYLLASCNEPDQPSASAAPKALEEKSDDSRFSSSLGRSDRDLVESLYKEQVAKSPALQELEKTLERLPEKKTDSTAAYYKYKDNNGDYYGTAGKYVAEIKDSLLREKIKMLLASSESAYKNKVGPLSKLMEVLAIKDTSLQDLHLALKIVKTIPVMERYQNDHLPATDPIQYLINQYEKAIQQTKSLIK